MNIFRDRDSVIGERPGQDFLKLKTISLSRMCDWKKIFWTLNNMSRQSCFFYIWMRAWTPLWSRILQEMTPIFFEHPDKLNLVMLEGGQRDSQLRGTNRRNFMSNFLLPSHHGPKQMLSWTKTKAIMDQNKCFLHREIHSFMEPAEETSCHQQNKFLVTKTKLLGGKLFTI